MQVYVTELLIVLTLVLFIACKKEKKEVAQNAETESQDIAPVNPEMMETAVIYEANIRQYSPEGTFEEFTKDPSHYRWLWNLYYGRQYIQCICSSQLEAGSMGWVVALE